MSPAGPVVTLYDLLFTVIVYDPPLFSFAGAAAAGATTKLSDFTGPFALSLKNFGATLGNIA